MGLFSVPAQAIYVQRRGAPYALAELLECGQKASAQRWRQALLQVRVGRALRPARSWSAHHLSRRPGTFQLSCGIIGG